jgi:hypothetical protein
MRVKLKEVANWGNVRLNDGGQLELIVKAGWRVRVQLKAYAYNYFHELEDFTQDSKVEYYETGLLGDSVAKVWLNGGAALAIAAEHLELSNSFKEEVGNQTQWWKDETGAGPLQGEWGKLGCYMSLTPRPDWSLMGEPVPDPEGGYQFYFNNEDDDVEVTLLEWERDELWVAAQENTRSPDSEGIEDYTPSDPESDDGGRARIDELRTVTRLYEREQDANGWFYDITILTNNDQEFFVYCNGIQNWMGYSEEEAIDAADLLKASIDENGLPPAYQRERGEEEPEAEPEWVAWAKIGIVVGGVLLGGYFIFRFVDSIAKGTASKVVGE